MNTWTTLGLLWLGVMTMGHEGHPGPLHRPQGPGKVPDGLRRGYEERLREKISSIPKETPKAVRAEMVSIHEKLTGSFLADLDSEGFLFGHPLNGFVDTVMATLLEQWPELSDHVRSLIARDATPNAYSMGEGTIVVNLGLLERLESEAQLAFVLAHELAHYGMDHSEKDIRTHAYRMHDKDLMKQVRSVNRSSYDRVEKLETILLDLTIGKRRHGRSNEYEADSVGLAVLARTRYQRSAALGTMDVLEACDHEPYRSPLDVAQAFAQAGNAFTPDLLRSAIGSSLGYVERERTALDDSLRTHPDCLLRRDRLDMIITHMGGDHGETHLTSPQRMQAIRYMARYELIDMHLFSPRPGPALYQALRFLEEHPEDVYCQAAVGIALATLHHYQSKRLVGHVLNRPHFMHSASYNRLLTLLWDMRLKELAELGHAWMDTHRGTETEDPEILLALALTSHAAGHYSEAMEHAERYRHLHPEGRHLGLLNERPGPRP